MWCPGILLAKLGRLRSRIAHILLAIDAEALDLLHNPLVRLIGGHIDILHLDADCLEGRRLSAVGVLVSAAHGVDSIVL